jgi:hypothetical protein
MTATGLKNSDLAIVIVELTSLLPRQKGPRSASLTLVEFLPRRFYVLPSIPEARLSAAQKVALAEIVETGPEPSVDGVVRWRRVDLQRVIKGRFGVDYHERHVGKLLKEPGFSHMSARPRHPPRMARSSRHLKKPLRTLKAHLADLPDGTPVVIWWQDEARNGQKWLGAAMGAAPNQASPAGRPAL